MDFEERKKIFLLVIVFILFLFYLFFLSSISRADVGKVMEEREITFFHREMENLFNFSKKISNPEIKFTIGFTLNEAYPVIALKSKKNLAFKVNENYFDRGVLGVAPLLKGKDYGNYWNEIAKRNNMATLLIFNDGGMLIVLKEEPKISPLWRSAVLLHEACHAFSFLEGEFDGIKDPLQRRIRSELKAYSIEVSFLSELGGKKFQQMLEEEVERILKEEKKYKGKISLPDYKRSGKLDAVFGKPESDFERKVRWSVFWIGANFRSIEKKSADKKSAEKRKLNFLYSCYKTGIME